MTHRTAELYAIVQRTNAEAIRCGAMALQAILNGHVELAAQWSSMAEAKVVEAKKYAARLPN